MSLFELVHALKYFRRKRERENVSQPELLKRELILIAQAILTIVILVGALVGFAFYFR